MIAERCRHILVHVNWPFVMLSTISGKKKNVRARVFCMTVIEIAVKDNQTVFEILFICRRLFKFIEEKSLRTQYHVWCVVRVCSWSVFVLFYYLYINWETSGIHLEWSTGITIFKEHSWILNSVYVQNVPVTYCI